MNFPQFAEAVPPLTRTRLGHSYYHGCFKQRGDQYHHSLTAAVVDPALDTDDAAVKAGQVSVTLIDMRALGQQI